jgi:Predicted membrane protein
MTLEPLLAAPLAVQIHVATVVPAALIGGWLLLSRKGTPVHKRLGRIWMALMIVTALSTFFIHEINLFRGYSPIHILSIATLAGCVQAVRMARARQIRRHKQIVKSLYFGGIGIAGLFALLPGRIMNRTIFGDTGAMSAWLDIDRIAGLARAAAEPGLISAAMILAVGATVLLARRFLKRRPAAR